MDSKENNKNPSKNDSNNGNVVDNANNKNKNNDKNSNINNNNNTTNINRDKNNKDNNNKKDELKSEKNNNKNTKEVKKDKKEKKEKPKPKESKLEQNKQKIIKYCKILLIILFIGLMSFQLRAQPADMKFTDNPQLKKMFADEHGRMYLVAIDPYYYLRLTENYFYHGYLGETIKIINGKKVPYDTCQYAPPGHPAPTQVPMITYATIGIYELWHPMDSTVTLMNAAFWVPAVLGILLGIPVFFIVRRITKSDIGGIVGSIILISSPALLYKTSAGFADTPIFETLPILFIVWFVLEALHYSSKNIKIAGLYAFLAMAVLVLAPRMWSGWWYGYYIVGGALILYGLITYVLKNYYKDNKFVKKWILIDVNFKNLLIISSIILIITTILLAILYGINFIINTLLAPFGYQSVLSTTELSSGWPNVFTTVAELTKPSLNDIINNSLGSAYLFVMGILGAILSIVSMRYSDKSIKIDLKYGILFILWIGATLYASTKGVRFIGLLVPPLSIGVGIFTGQIINLIKRRDDDLIKWALYPVIVLMGLYTLYKYYPKIPEILLPTTYVPIAAYGLLIVIALLVIYKIKDIISVKDENTKYKKIVALLLGISLIIPPLSAAVPFVTVPTLNNGWLESLHWLKYDTPKNAVITCWWDNGHIYTWATRKMVTFDGGSQNSPRAYWVGRAFATSNENLSIGILRMLATSGDEAFNESSVLMKKTKSVKETVKILNEILPVNRSTAYSILTKKYNLTDAEAKEVLNATHPVNTNPDYLITYNRMTSIATVWSMFGFWNFSLPPNTPNSKREMGYYFKLRGDAINYNGSLVIRLPLKETNKYVAMDIIEIKNNTILYCNEIAIDKQTNKILQQKVAPYHKVIVKIDPNNNLIERVINPNGDNSLIVRVKREGPYYVVYGWVSSRNLEDSIYTHLHFLDGAGLKHIKYVKGSLDPTNPGIEPGFKVYKVDYGKEYLK